MKRILLLFSTLMLSISALWAHDVEIDGIYYNLDEIKKTAIVTYSGNYYDSVHDEYSGSVTIPETITYNSEIYSVTSIGDNAFYGCSGLTSLTIGNSVTSIGSAFYNCSGLTKVNYLGTVDKWVEIDFENFNSKPTYYANDLYINNELLTDVKITTANSIKDYAFYNCQSIKSVEIGESVTSIGSSAFSICSGLTEVTIGNSVTSIGRYAFHNSSGLTSVTIGNSVTFIGGGAFNNTGIYYSESNWDNGVLYIDNCLIEAKSDVVKGSYTIKEGTRVIGSSAFYNCSGLTEVTIPNSVTSIGNEAFNGCSGLTSVTIPNSVTSIGANAFSDCSGLTSVTIPNSVTFIAPLAFEGCSGLTSVVWNAKNCEDFKSYNVTPFNNIRSSITSFTFGNEVEHIPAYLCRHMENLKEVTIGNSVTSIGYRAFSDCSGLTSVTIPNSVTSIDSYTFDGCSGLTEILVSSNNDEFSSENGVLYNNDKTTLIIYPEGKKDTSFTIPTSVTSIGSYAFRGCSGLTSVTIPNSVTSIGKYAFYNTGIYDDESNWDNGVLYIDNCLIKAKSNVVKGSYTIKEGTRIIGSSAFSGCSGLTSVTIPNSVISIGSSAFSGCDSLKTVYNCSNLEIKKGNEDHGYVAYYADEVINACPVGDFIVNYEDEIIEYIGDTTVNKIEIPEFVKGIEPDVFASCANIDTIVWNAINCADFTETTAPFNAQAAQIKSVIFGNNVEYIPAYLCSDMTLLTEISIPGKVNSIGENAFVGCSRLRYITSYPTLVPLAKVNSFNSYSAYLYIPCDYYDYYYLDDVFGKFKEIKCISAEEVEGSEKVEIEVDSNNNATIIWPSTGNASSYELVISKNGEVFCTLIFNSNGQLASIDFGKRSASVGFQFIVTGLDGASKYKYQMTAIDKKGNEITSYKGVFATNGYEGSLEDDEEDEPTDVVETLADTNITISDGLISCQDADFTIYNTLGQDVTAYNGSLQPGVYVVSIAEDVIKVIVK